MADCSGNFDGMAQGSYDEALRLKLGAIAVIFCGSGLGVAIPLVARELQCLRAESRAFLTAKAFAAGVILATGFVHILGEATARLSSRCLPSMPWHSFPWTGFIVMMAALLSLVVDSLGTEYYERRNGVLSIQGKGLGSAKRSSLAGSNSERVHNESLDDGPQDHIVQVELVEVEEDNQNMRFVVISQVLELGIITHSMIIGISLGVSQSPSTIRPLFAALAFHQFFEGIALGGCIAQARFQARVACVMGCFYAITAPVGIALGIAIASSYNDNSRTSLIVQGVLDAVSAGILIYLSLVDLIAHDFHGQTMKGNLPLQTSCYVSLYSGAMAMAAIAVWT